MAGSGGDSERGAAVAVDGEQVVECAHADAAHAKKCVGGVVLRLLTCEHQRRPTWRNAARGAQVETIRRPCTMKGGTVVVAQRTRGRMALEHIRHHRVIATQRRDHQRRVAAHVAVVEADVHCGADLNELAHLPMLEFGRP